ncbi:MAG: hypothetical protein ACLSB9_20725 [Hydrogeniiclostridium mannosilyticum]
MKIEQVIDSYLPNQNYLFVKLITDSGVYGWGMLPERPGHTVADITSSTPILIGRDPESRISGSWYIAELTGGAEIS